MEKLLEEIKNNIATLKCRLEEVGIDVMLIQTESWDFGEDRVEFKIGTWDGEFWMTDSDGKGYAHSISKFREAIEWKKILFRKF